MEVKVKSECNKIIQLINHSFVLNKQPFWQRLTAMLFIRTEFVKSKSSLFLNIGELTVYWTTQSPALTLLNILQQRSIHPDWFDCFFQHLNSPSITFDISHWQQGAEPFYETLWRYSRTVMLKMNLYTVNYIQNFPIEFLGYKCLWLMN